MVLFSSSSRATLTLRRIEAGTACAFANSANAALTPATWPGSVPIVMLKLGRISPSDGPLYETTTATISPACSRRGGRGAALGHRGAPGPGPDIAEGRPAMHVPPPGEASRWTLPTFGDLSCN